MKLWNRLSLPLKLTLLYVGLLALILSTLGTVLYLDNRRFLVQNLAARVRAQAKPVIARRLQGPLQAPPLLGREQGPPGPPPLQEIAPGLARDLTSRDSGALILDRRGRVLARGKVLPEEPESAPPEPVYYRRALAGENEVSYPTYWRGAHVLVVLIPLRPHPRSPRVLGVVQLTTPLAPIDDILFRQRLVLLVGIALALLAGTLLGLLITSSALKGLTRMVATCQGISAGDYGRRVGLSGRGDVVGHLSRAFDQMAERIQAAFQAQKRLVANAAHELRTPLTALQGSLEVLLRGVQDDPVAASRLVRVMYQETRRLSRMCEQLLDLSRLEASTNLEKRPLELGSFIRELVPRLALLAPKHRLELAPGPEVTISADPELLTRVILNLVDNAAKHTPEGGRIELGWRTREQGTELWVSDGGEGIDPAILPQVFEPFFQGGKGSGSKGAGLGLALVKAMVEAHGGSIQVESRPGRGTRFGIFLPA